MKLKPKNTVEAGKFSMSAMSDIAFLLIIFFMVCAQFVEKSDIPVKLPLSRTGNEAEELPIKVTINSEGAIFVNGVSMSASEVFPELRGRIRTAEGTEGKIVVVRAHRSLAYGTIRPVVDAVDRAGGTLELSVVSK
jgi:biopolymer transport protein ExbD